MDIVPLYGRKRLNLLKFLRTGETDEDLLQKIASGDSPAEERFCAKYRERVLFLVRNKLGAIEDAEDVCHDIITAVLNAAKQGKINRLAPFLHKVCSNHVNNWLRKEYRRRAEVHEQEEALRAPEEDALEHLIDEEDRRNIDQALKKLNRRELKIIKLKYDLELSSKEIGQILDLSSDVVRKTAERARKKIAAELRTK